MRTYQILKKPLLTEKSLLERDNQNRYGFVVAKDASKGEIKTAVEKIFNVTVTKINTISVRGRFRRQGMHAGYTAASKKAIVTLTKDSKEIEFFNSMV